MRVEHPLRQRRLGIGLLTAAAAVAPGTECLAKCVRIVITRVYGLVILISAGETVDPAENTWYKVASPFGKHPEGNGLNST